MVFEDTVADKRRRDPVFAIGQQVFDGLYSTVIWRIMNTPRWSSRSGCWWYLIVDGRGKIWEAPEDILFAARINKKMLVKMLKVVA
jgi:hypothetical protein